MCIEQALVLHEANKSRTTTTVFGQMAVLITDGTVVEIALPVLLGTDGASLSPADLVAVLGQAETREVTVEATRVTAAVLGDVGLTRLPVTRQGHARAMILVTE